MTTHYIHIITFSSSNHSNTPITTSNKQCAVSYDSQSAQRIHLHTTLSIANANKWGEVSYYARLIRYIRSSWLINIANAEPHCAELQYLFIIIYPSPRSTRHRHIPEPTHSNCLFITSNIHSVESNQFSISVKPNQVFCVCHQYVFESFARSLHVCR